MYHMISDGFYGNARSKYTKVLELYNADCFVQMSLSYLNSCVSVFQKFPVFVACLKFGCFALFCLLFLFCFCLFFYKLNAATNTYMMLTIHSEIIYPSGRLIQSVI